MSRKKNKIIEVIISLGNNSILEKKLKVDEKFVDTFFIINLMMENFSSEELSTSITEKPVHIHNFEVPIGSNFDQILTELSVKVREILMDSDLDLEDSIFISKSNEFIDFRNFDFEELITSNFLVLQHKKIFWNYDLTDNRYSSGTIVINFSNILQKNFFIQVFDYFSSNFDVLDHVKNKNGWVLFGFEDYKEIIKKMKFNFYKLFLDKSNENEKYLENLSNKLLPIENYDLLKTELLKKTETSEEIKKEFQDNNIEIINPKTIKINVNNYDIFINDFDISLKITDNIFDHLLFDETNKTFFVYKPSYYLYKDFDEKYHINELKKLLSILNIKDEDVIKIGISDFYEIEDFWIKMKNKNISDYIKNPL